MKPRISTVAVIVFALAASTGCRNLVVGLLSAGPATASALWDDVRQAHTGGQRVRSVSFHSDVAYAPGAGALMFPESPAGWSGYHVLAPAEGRALLVMRSGTGRRSWAREDGNLVTLRNGLPYAPRGPITPEHQLAHLRALVMPWDPTDHPAVKLAWLPDDADGNIRVRLQEEDGACDTYDMTVDRDLLLVVGMDHRSCGGGLPVLVRMRFMDHRAGTQGITTAHRVEIDVGPGALAVPVQDVTLGSVTWVLEPVLPAARPRFP